MKAAARILTPTGAFRAWATVTMLIIGFGLALGLTIAYVNRVDHRADARNQQRAREICGLMRVLDDAYQQTPPTTPTGRTVAAEIHRYRVNLGC
jgi:hypothetical protein